jgi:hypothetical protein
MGGFEMGWLFRTAWIGAAVCAAVAPASANFMASDLIYVPVVAHNDGLEGTLWRSDLYLTNVDEVAVDVSLFFFPSGLFDNARYLSRTFGAGGREEYGFNVTDEQLADIPPGGSIVITDVVGEYWLEDFGSSASLGGMAIFAYEAGTLDAPDGRVFRNVVASCRTYNETTQWVPDPENEGEFIEVNTSYGQTVPGVPWQNLADAEAVNELGDFTYFIINGAREDENYRFNLGIFNTSDELTTLSIRLEPLQPDGTPYEDEDGNPLSSLITMPPLSQTQYFRPLLGLFGIEEAVGASFRVSLAAWSSRSSNPIPTFTAYGSQVDGNSQDPTTFLPSFGFPYNVECMWPGPGDPGGKSAVRRAVDHPPREGVDGSTSR